jgi:hypothetical protein
MKTLQLSDLEYDTLMIQLGLNYDEDTGDYDIDEDRWTDATWNSVRKKLRAMQGKTTLKLSANRVWDAIKASSTGG